MNLKPLYKLHSTQPLTVFFNSNQLMKSQFPYMLIKLQYVVRASERASENEHTENKTKTDPPPTRTCGSEAANDDVENANANANEKTTEEEKAVERAAGEG